MKAKFDSGITPPRGKFQGGVYQSYSAGHQLLSNKRNSRSRYPNQFTTAAIMAKVTRAWAFLTSGERDAWNVWAATYPQPCRYRSGCYLTGYQNFLQRNFYELLFFGINAPLITSPVLAVVADTTVTPQLTRSGADLLLNYSWSRSGGDIWAGVFVSHIISQGKLYNLNFPRFVGVIDNGGGFVPRYGLIYNFLTISDSRLISSSNDWSVASSSQISALRAFVNSGLDGYKLYTIGNDFWYSNPYGNNFYGLNIVGCGGRNVENTASGNFSYGPSSSVGGSYGFCWAAYSTSRFARFIGSSGKMYLVNGYSFNSYAIRLTRPAVGISDGVTGSYIGNDGKKYKTIVINGVEWLASNLCETKWRTGAIIDYFNFSENRYYTNTEWKALTGGAVCAYKDNWDLAFSSGSTSFNLSEGWGRNFGVLPNVGDYVILRFVKVGKTNGQFLGEEQFTLPVAA